MRIEESIQYASTPNVDPNLQSLDLYAPEEAANLPVLLFVHGGAWANGDKANVEAKAEGFTAAGYVFATTNYRLVPDAAFPAHAEDVASAVAWLRSNVAVYGGDPESIFLVGHSAGAHLVALVATDERYLGRHGLDLQAIRAVAAIDTLLYDIPAVLDSMPEESPESYRRVFGDDREFWRFASPATYIAPGKGIPACIVAFSGATGPEGSLSRPAEAKRVVEKLRGAGVAADLLPALEKTHAQISLDLGTADDHVTRRVLSFFAEHPAPVLAIGDALQRQGKSPARP